MAVEQARWRIWVDRPKGSISPNLYGHFAEHLGRCIYEGIWVGPDSPIPNDDGLRRDTIAALRELPTPVLRWPGGCFADDYHWQDGVGPRDERPPWRNLWWHGEESHQFGTDEFITLCRQINAQPYICANVGTGTPDEALAWLEYCNGSGQTRYARLRRQYGHEDPYGVRYWGVGNETWGCGGNMTPEQYAAEYRRFATYLKARESGVELVAVGHTTPDWNRRFLAALELEQSPRLLRLLDHLSIHRYFRGPSDAAFSEDQYYDLQARTLQLEDEIRRTRDALSYYTGGQKRVGVIVDEWGTWYAQARNDSGLQQQNTLQDAVVAGACLNLFNRWCDTVMMANIAQTVNVLQCLVQTAGDRLWLTPTYHVFHLYAAHHGNQALEDELVSPEREVPPDSQRRLPLLSTSASRSTDGGALVVTLVNRHLGEPVECLLRLQGAAVREGELRQLAGDDVHAYNSSDAPDRVQPQAVPFRASGAEFAVVLPPHSVSALTLHLTS